MIIKLPASGRPRFSRYKQCALGVDLPASFIHSLKSIDENLYPVWHASKMLWDSIINDYAGPLDDPRYQISYNYGELNFGFVLTDGVGAPVPEGKWHIWRWCEPVVGWAHVINIDSKDPKYLELLIRRLWLQAMYNDRYGHRAYNKLLAELEQGDREKKMSERQDLFNEISKTNSELLNSAKQNFERGVTRATNPTKRIITSYRGQGNRSAIERPITDREGGLILPDSFE